MFLLNGQPIELTLSHSPVRHRGEITGAVPKAGNANCSGPGCGEYVAITCQR